MADERSTGFAELKAVALHILQQDKHRPPGPATAHEQGSKPMDTRDQHRKDPPPRQDTGDQGADESPAPQPQAGRDPADQQRPATPSAARDAREPAPASDRREDYGAGAEPDRGQGDADSRAWPPGDWNENGNANRHGQSREGRGPGGYDDRSRELRDFGPGPEGSSGEAWRTYEHHADGDAGQDRADDKSGKDNRKPSGDDGSHR